VTLREVVDVEDSHGKFPTKNMEYGIRAFLSLNTNPFFNTKTDMGAIFLKTTRTILKLSSLYGRDNSKNKYKTEIVLFFVLLVMIPFFKNIG
jgi:hypothetical protein